LSTPGTAAGGRGTEEHGFLFIFDQQQQRRNGVKRTIEIALVALALGAPLAAVAPSPARADASIAVDPGRIAFGYRDG
jgi:hypothetical protein